MSHCRIFRVQRTTKYKRERGNCKVHSGKHKKKNHTITKNHKKMKKLKFQVLNKKPPPKKWKNWHRGSSGGSGGPLGGSESLDPPYGLHYPWYSLCGVRVASHFKNEGIFRFAPPPSDDGPEKKSIFSHFSRPFSFSYWKKKKRRRRRKKLDRFEL